VHTFHHLYQLHFHWVSLGPDPSRIHQAWMVGRRHYRIKRGRQHARSRLGNIQGCQEVDSIPLLQAKDGPKS
jgi:hypothetical protein